MTDNLDKPCTPDGAGYRQGVADGKAEADAWHAAVLAECQLTEACCYVEADPAGTVCSLIDWHVDVTVRGMIDWRKEDAAAVPQEAQQYRAALEHLRAGMVDAKNTNIVDYIDAVLGDAAPQPAADLHAAIMALLVDYPPDVDTEGDRRFFDVGFFACRTAAAALVAKGGQHG